MPRALKHPLREVPQSVRVVTSALIEDLGATRLSDTVDYVSGIAGQNDFGGTWDNYAIRGFSSTDMGYGKWFSGIPRL